MTVFLLIWWVASPDADSRHPFFKKEFPSGVECINTLDPYSFDKLIIGGRKPYVALPDGHGYVEMECTNLDPRE